MDAILMDYCSDPQIGEVQENKITSIKATYSTIWTSTHTPSMVSFNAGQNKTGLSVISGNTKVIPIGEDLDSTLVLATIEDDLKSKRYLGQTVKDRHNHQMLKSWQPRH